MGAIPPVEIGTCGTVGSLVTKEIEYFRRLELDRCGSSTKTRKHIIDVGSSLGFLLMRWRRKKRKGSGFLPGICSVVEIAESHRLNGIPGFNYRSIKAEENNFEF